MVRNYASSISTPTPDAAPALGSSTDSGCWQQCPHGTRRFAEGAGLTGWPVLELLPVAATKNFGGLELYKIDTAWSLVNLSMTLAGPLGSTADRADVWLL